MHLKFFTTILTAFICFNSFAQQKKFLYYFDDKLIESKKSKSVFTGTGIMENGLLSLTIIENKSERPIVLSHYTDSSLTTSQGLFQSFFINGIKETEGNFDAGKENGLWKKWDNKGRLLDSTYYNHGKKTTGTKYSYYRNGGYHYKFEDFEKNTMKQVVYNDSGKVTSEVSFVGDKGIVKRFSKEGNTVDTVFTREEIEASFPGGDAAWARYIKGVIERNIDLITRDGQSGTCRVKFIIDKEGNVSNVEILTMKGSVLAAVTKDALQNGPKWKPAIQYGKPVKAYREQPVTFTIQNSK